MGLLRELSVLNKRDGAFTVIAEVHHKPPLREKRHELILELVQDPVQEMTAQLSL